MAERAAEKRGYGLQQLTAIVKNSSLLGKARGIGLLMAIEIARPQHAQLLQRVCFKKGLYAGISEGRFITLSPPLTLLQ